jgi:pimeloyl-ACP methyl ester carboxylesterase
MVITLIRACLAAFLLASIQIATDTAAGATNNEIPQRDVAFVSQRVTLHGTLFMPAEPPAFAAVVWVDGAGRTKRNPGLGQLLARRGIAVLTYDKRGVGASGGVYAGPEIGTNNVSAENLTLLAEDAAAALHALGRESGLGNVPRGFIGGSQAGWVIPLAASKSRDARFMLLWSGAVETTHENFLFERTALADERFWIHHTHDDVRKIMNGVVDDLVWASFDPHPVLNNLSIPGLWMFGGRDRNVDVDLSIARLNGLIAGGHPDYSYRVFTEYDHALGGEREDVIAPSVAWIRKITERVP